MILLLLLANYYYYYYYYFYYYNYYYYYYSLILLLLANQQQTISFRWAVPSINADTRDLLAKETKPRLAISRIPSDLSTWALPLLPLTTMGSVGSSWNAETRSYDGC